MEAERSEDTKFNNRLDQYRDRKPKYLSSLVITEVILHPLAELLDDTRASFVGVPLLLFLEDSERIHAYRHVHPLRAHSCLPASAFMLTGAFMLTVAFMLTGDILFTGIGRGDSIFCTESILVFLIFQRACMI